MNITIKHFAPIFFIISLLTSLLADVKSSTGNIYFNVDRSGGNEFVMNQNGLGIGTTTPAANLHLNGTVAQGFQSVSSDTTLGQHSLVLANTASNSIFLTLPYAANVSGRRYQVKKTNPLNSLHIKGGGNYIDTYSILSLAPSQYSTLQNPSVELMSDGSQWQIIQSQGNLCEFGNESGNLVGWWPLDESDANSTLIIDRSGFNNHATLTNFNSSGNGIVSGNIGYARSFDGSNDYISAGNSHSLNLTGPFTISFWFYAKTISNWDRLVSKLNTAQDNGFQFLLDSSQILKFQCITGGSTRTSTSDSAITTGRWYHIVGRYNRSKVQLYVDKSAQSATGNWSADIGLNADPIIFASKFGTANHSDVIMDDIRIYNKALSTTEISALYELGH
jgi:hypothetical protein